MHVVSHQKRMCVHWTGQHVDHTLPSPPLFFAVRRTAASGRTAQARESSTGSGMQTRGPHDWKACILGKGRFCARYDRLVCLAFTGRQKKQLQHPLCYDKDQKTTTAWAHRSSYT